LKKKRRSAESVRDAAERRHRSPLPGQSLHRARNIKNAVRKGGRMRVKKERGAYRKKTRGRTGGVVKKIGTGPKNGASHGGSRSATLYEGGGSGERRGPRSTGGFQESVVSVRALNSTTWTINHVGTQECLPTKREVANNGL